MSLYHFENYDFQEILLSKLTKFTHVNNVMETSPSTHMVFFGKIHVFLQLHRIGIFGAKRDYIHLKTPKL
jgi:hypothetical protein